MIYLVTTQKQMFDLPTNMSFASIPECLGYFALHKAVAVDTETEGFDPYTKDILSLQLGDGKNQYVIDLSTVSIQIFKELLETKELIFQNAKFDLKFLYRYGIIPTQVYDTYLAELILTTGIMNHRRGLDALVYRYCQYQLDKTVRGDIHREGLSSRVIKYAAEDVMFLHDIRQKQEAKIKEAGLKMALKLDNWFVRVLAYIEFCGIYLDPIKWGKKSKEDLVKLAIVKKELDDWVINNKPEYIQSQLDMFDTGLKCDINWNSQKQVIPLFKELGVNTVVQDKKTGKNKDSIDASILEAQKTVHPLIPIYLKYSKAQKLVSTFGEDYFKYINSVTGRVHTTYKQIMNTGRMSCGEQNKKIGVAYPNLQQVPSDERHRSCFTPQKKHGRLIVCDYSGQESVIFTNFTKEAALINFYQQGLGDMHSYIASKIYPELEGLPLETIKSEHKSKRQEAKAAGFAIQYGGQGITIARNLGISEERGNEIYNAYFKAFAGVKDYFKKVKAAALKNGFVEINPITKRKSYADFYDEYQKLKSRVSEDGFWDKYRSEKEKQSEIFVNEMKPLVRKKFQLEGTLERKSYNYPIQGTGADMTKLAGCYIFEWILEKNYFDKVKIINIVHDEIMVECDVDISEDVAKVVQESMEKSASIFCKIIPLKASPEIAKWWTH